MLLSAPATAATPEVGTCAVAGGDTLHVATLNTWGLPYPLSRDRIGRFSRISTYLDRDWDVVGLQEVWRGARGLLRHNLRYPHGDADSGLALYSRLPATVPELHPFRAAAGPDRLKSKGVMTSQVDLPDGHSAWMVVTHMQAGRSERSQRVRALQVEEILGVLSDLQGPAVVMGDFNLSHELPVDAGSHARLVDAGLADAAQVSGSRRSTYPGLRARFDRIYVRGGDGTCLVPERTDVGSDTLSDHRPVHADIRVHAH